nr:hypothetical protein [uncultured Holophaga sp.]
MILESTLREGMQRYGLRLDTESRWRMLQGLAQAGIPEIEIGACGRDESLGALMTRWRRAGLPGLVSVWCPLRAASLEHAARLGPDRVNLSIPTSEGHIRERLHLDQKGLESLLEKQIGVARRLGLEWLSLGFEDASRTPLDRLLTLARLAQELGVRRIRLSDTVGILDPTRTTELVRSFRQGCSLEIGFHGHNDFGMATANALAALDAGADWVDTTLLGIGERSGIAATEELAGFLHFQRQSPLPPAPLAALARTFQREAGLTLTPWKAVVGEALFHAESGMHVQGLLVDPALYEPFDPSAVGATRKLGLGTQTGHSAVRLQLQEGGLDPALAEELVSRIRHRARGLGRPLGAEEVFDLAFQQSARR